jgi:hypothetical protein
MIELPSIYQASEHETQVTIGNTAVWFSYSTPIAFKIGSNPLVIRQNEWKQTTGRHINNVDNGRKLPRVNGEEFARLWSQQSA